MAKSELTNKERETLQEYLDKMDDLAAREPDYIFTDQKIADAWEKWHAEGVALNNEYHDVIAKALVVSFDDWKDDPQSVAQILRAFMSDDPGAAAAAMHSQLAIIKQYGLMNDKINRMMLSGQGMPHEIDGQFSLEWSVNQGRRGRPAVPSLVSLTYEGDEITTSRKMEGYDYAVLAGVTNLYYTQCLRGEPAPYNVTPDDIWRSMHGLIGTNKKPTKKQRQEVIDSVEKQRFTRLEMDITAEISKHGLQIDDDRVTGGFFSGYYLPAEKITFITEKGRKLEGYQLLQMPFLYVYNMAKKNLVFIDGALLDTSDTTGNEGNTAQIKFYLLREIGLMYKGWRDSSRILYDTIYIDGGVKTPEERTKRSYYKSDNSYDTVIRRKAKDDRDKIDALLLSWKNKGYIKDFSKFKKGRSYAGIEIELNPDNFEKERPRLAEN